jgi:hypothetical protein
MFGLLFSTLYLALFKSVCGDRRTIQRSELLYEEQVSSTAGILQNKREYSMLSTR